MNSTALVIGIDDYAFGALTSAVNDALAFAETLLELDLVEPVNLMLLLAPREDRVEEIEDALVKLELEGGYQQATRDNIGDALDKIRAAAHDRLYFFYAGHGLLGYTDAGHTMTESVLLPSDVKDPSTGGHLMISVERMLKALEAYGPRQQYYFFDACRNLNPTFLANLPSLSFSGSPKPGPARSQQQLFAVSTQGEALARRAGHGMMTRHLLDGLRGRGRALTFWEDGAGDESYVVTMRSLHHHVRDELLQELAGVAGWKLKYALPELRGSGPEAEPLRRLDPDSVDPVPLSLEVSPPEAENHLEVKVTFRRFPVPGASWPPLSFEDSVELPPMSYRVSAASSKGRVSPEFIQRDLRIDAQRRASFTVPPPGGSRPTSSYRFHRYFLGGPGSFDGEYRALLQDLQEGEDTEAAPPKDVPRAGHPIIEMQQGPLAATAQELVSAGEATLRVEALEQETAIEVELLQDPGTTHKAFGALDTDLHPGPYEIRFRIGPRVFNAARLELEPGDRVTVRATAEASAVLSGERVRFAEDAGAITLPDSYPYLAADGSVERLGAMQGALASTIDPLLAAELSVDGIPRSHHSVLMVLVVFEGEEWPALPALAARAACWTSTHGGASRSPVALSALGREPLDRVLLGVAEPPSASFATSLSIPGFTTVHTATSSVYSFITVVTLIVRPDGDLELSHNLLPDPANSSLLEELGWTGSSYPRIVRELQLGQLLFRSNELLEPAAFVQNDTLLRLFRAELFDPVLSAMCAHAVLSRWQATGEMPRIGDTLRQQLLDIQHQHHRLPADSAVLRALFHRRHPQDDELERHGVPLLIHSARAMMAHYTRHGIPPGPLAGYLDLGRPGDPWLASWDTDRPRFPPRSEQ